MNKKQISITRAAAIAALYIVLTLISNAFGLASGVIQVRISEALTILPAFCSAAIPGLFVGCLLSNIICGNMLPDIIFGSLATLLGALGTRYLSKSKYTAPLYPIIANVVIIPPVLKYVYNFEGALWYFVLTVGIGEIISCGILGIILYSELKKRNIFN